MIDLEFSRIININKVHKQNENTYTYNANDTELTAITRRLNILKVESLCADITAKIYKKDHLLISGIIKSKVIQESIISLSEVSEDVETNFSVIFSYDDLRNNESLMNMDNNLEIESMEEDGSCEVGEIVVQELSLALNGFPKTQEDQKFEVFTYGDEIPEDTTKNPFAVLKDLKNK